jgi:PST family polysaccharide transporter
VEVNESLLGRRTAIGSLLVVASRLATRLIDFATMLLVARFLTPTDFGLVALATSVMQIAEAVTELPVYQVLVRVPALTRPHYDTAFTLGLLRGLGLMSILASTAIPIAYAYGEPRLTLLIGFLALAPALRSLASPRMAQYQRQLSFWRDIVVETSGKVVALAVAVVVAVMTGSYWAIPAGSVAFSLAMTAVSYMIAPYRPRLSMAEFALFWRFLTWSGASQLINATNWQFERLLLGKLKSPSELGLFTTANDFAGIPFSAIFTPIYRPLLSSFSLLRSDRLRLARSYQTISNAIVAVGLPLVVGESLLAEPTIGLLLGERWRGAAPLMQWLALSLIPAVFAVAAGPLIVACDEMRVFVQRSVMEFCIKLPIALFGAIEFGFWGVIVARVVSEIAVNTYSIVTVRRLVGLSVLEQFLGPWRSIASTAAMVPVVLGCLRLFGNPDGTADASAHLMGAVTTGAATYSVMSWTLWCISGRPDGPEALAVKALRRIWSGAI